MPGLDRRIAGIFLLSSVISGFAVDGRARADLIGVTGSLSTTSSSSALDTSRFHPAIARRHDRDDSVFINAGADYPSVGRIQFKSISGTGVLIAPNKVLTAAHVLSSLEPISDFTFTINNTVYTAASKTLSPTWTNFQASILKGDDIAILTLSSDVVGVTPAELYTGRDEIGRVGTSVGFGFSGTGLTGQMGGLGTRRAGDNMIDAFGSLFSGININSMLMDFDDPLEASSLIGSATPLDRESLVTQGDSGGGLFVDFGNGPLLVGITSFLFDVNDNDILSDYSDMSGAIRVSANLDFIRNAIAVPEPASVVTILVGGLFIATHRTIRSRRVSRTPRIL
ncbi:MAG: trypsin-like serine protease [Isosphaeraceae bacterium]|nr:trypsin-like serine protease [Isosphaeraceae bacterium]